MYYLIKEGKIRNSSDKYLSSEGYETIQKDFSQEELEKLNSGYLYIDGEIAEGPEVKEFEKNKLKTELEQLDNELLTLNGKIKGGEELIEMGVSDQDDVAQVEEMKTRVTEMINRRIELKTQIKYLTV